MPQVAWSSQPPPDLQLPLGCASLTASPQLQQQLSSGLSSGLRTALSSLGAPAVTPTNVTYTCQDGDSPAASNSGHRRALRQGGGGSSSGGGSGSPVVMRLGVTFATVASPGVAGALSNSLVSVKGAEALAEGWQGSLQPLLGSSAAVTVPPASLEQLAAARRPPPPAAASPSPSSSPTVQRAPEAAPSPRVLRPPPPSPVAVSSPPVGQRWEGSLCIIGPPSKAVAVKHAAQYECKQGGLPRALPVAHATEQSAGLT